jgi:hypothetical protein
LRLKGETGRKPGLASWQLATDELAQSEERDMHILREIDAIKDGLSAIRKLIEAANDHHSDVGLWERLGDVVDDYFAEHYADKLQAATEARDADVGELTDAQADLELDRLAGCSDMDDRQRYNAIEARFPELIRFVA